MEIPHLKNGEWLDFFYLSLAFPQQQMSSSHCGNRDPAATWLKWFIFNIYIFFYLLSLERRMPYLCRCFETEVLVAACPGLCHDCPHWGMGVQGCLVCAAAENAYASTIWYLWVQEHLFRDSVVLFADASSSVKKLLVISHLSLFIFKTGIRNFPENSELIF